MEAYFLSEVSFGPLIEEDPVTRIAFDPLQEVAVCGLESGYLSTLLSPSLEVRISWCIYFSIL
jgi:hypothetical protein